MPQSAPDILIAKGNLRPEQFAYLEAFTVKTDEALPVSEPAVEAMAVPVEASSSSSEDYNAKGKTTFGELIAWGVLREKVEQLIGASMPDPAMKVKDFTNANGLDFETLKMGLQSEVDQVKS